MKAKSKTPEAPDKPKRPTPAHGVQLLTRAQVAEALVITQRSLSKLIAKGQFPRANVIVGEYPRWSESLIREWIEAGPGREIKPHANALNGCGSEV